ncbi:MAG: Ig-like domain-containing protein [Sporocytophaga sp.]|nr:Ig-like domain-containing protein [Sporocytophaga sp.]
MYQTINGNGTIIARVSDWNNPNKQFKAGIMIRESLQSNSIQTMLVKPLFGGHIIAQRTASTNDLHNDPNGIGNMHLYNLYNWLKITRTGNEFISYCSRDGVNWVPLAQQTINMPAQVMFGLCVTGGIQYSPARASFDNVSISTVNAACTFSGTKISGTSIGTAGSWNNDGATRDKAFDGNILTDFDAPTGDAWTGLSLGSGHRITGIKYYPRRKSADRMVGGKFQGSNSADFSSGVVDLATITVEPFQDWNCITVNNTTYFAYIRYVGPSGGHANVAEIEFYGTVQTVNQLPIISITSPVTNQSFAAPATITINTDVTDADDNVWKVEFYNGSTWLGSDFTAPYSYTWNNVPAGIYNITALAIDNLGASSSSTRNNIVVIANTAPSISITSPVTNQSFAAPANITITTEVTDAENNITKVDFYNGSTLLGSDLTAPYSYTWNNVPAGVYNITALVIDNQNATASSTRNNITVIANTPPTVSITSPAANAAFTAPATVTISANAADANGTVSKVEFFSGTTLLNTDNTAPYSYSWAGVAAGTYSITAKATDNSGAVTTSAAISITVTASTANITGPACANNNQTLTYELAPSLRASVYNYGWYFTGSTQSFIPSGYQATLVTGSNYGAGQLCVGVSLNAAPWHTTYCITVPKCSGAREDETETLWTENTAANTLSFPNPFENEVTLTLPSDNEPASIEVFNVNGIRVVNVQATGSYTFGNELSTGIYFVKISRPNKTEAIKVVKK